MNIVEQLAKVVVNISTALRGPRRLILSSSPAELRGLARGGEDKHYFDHFLAHCLIDIFVSLDTYCVRSIVELFS